MAEGSLEGVPSLPFGNLSTGDTCCFVYRSPVVVVSFCFFVREFFWFCSFL